MCGTTNLDKGDHVAYIEGFQVGVGAGVGAGVRSLVAARVGACV